MPTTQLIKLKKPHGSHAAGASVYATKEELAAAKLKPGRDYEPLGTAPAPRGSTLNANATEKAGGSAK